MSSSFPEKNHGGGESDEQAPGSHSHLQPMSPPPAAAPPSPPVNTVRRNNDMDPLLPPSYQYGSVATNNSSGSGDSSTYANSSRAAALPKIRHYLEDDDIAVLSRKSTTAVDPRSFFQNSAGYFVHADASLRPNNGLTNSYDTALFGLALNEILEKLRLTNIVASVVSILLLMLTWLFRLIAMQLTKLVLTCYLSFFSLVLLMLEVMSIYDVGPSVDAFVKDNFGLLRYPLGKAAFIFFLATLCWALGGMAEAIVGILYFCSSSVLLFVWVTDPEFRRFFDESEKVDQQPRNSERVSWTEYASSFSSYIKVSSSSSRSSSGGVGGLMSSVRSVSERVPLVRPQVTTTV